MKGIDMIVKQLIEELKKFPDYLEVYYHDYENGDTIVSEVLPAEYCVTARPLMSGRSAGVDKYLNQSSVTIETANCVRLK